MDEITMKAFKLLRDVKSVVFSTINKGEPDSRVIDIMLANDDGLYFLTARGKQFYKQIGEHQRLAICGMDRNYVSVRIRGDIRLCRDRAVVNEIFEHNPMMNDLYPGEKRDILEAFHLFKGKGEIFDLSVTPPTRKRFGFGGEKVSPPGYVITEACTACGLCAEACPEQVITEGNPYSIDGSRCLECGRCAEVCPEGAIRTASGL